MKTRLFSSVVCLCFTLSFYHLEAQLTPTYETTLTSNCEKVFVHSVYGIPVFKTASTYEAIHPETYELLWKVDRQSLSGLSDASSEGGFNDYFELPFSSIAYVGNSFVEVVSGKIIVDGKADEVRRINRIHFFPSQDLLLVKVAAKGAYRLYALNTLTNALMWKTDIDNIGALSTTGLMDNDPVVGTTKGLKPYITDDGKIVYVHEKDMILLDAKTGKLIWSQPLEPGITLFNEKGNLIAIAERRGGLGALMDLSGGTKFGKRLVVVETATGENAWKKEIKLDGNIQFLQPYRSGFIVAHEEGFNIYDFNSPKGEPQWKKDFAAKEIADIVESGDNIMVYYRDRRMLMNPVTGDDVWKKPEKLAKEVPVFSGGQAFTVGNVKITRSGSSLRFVRESDNAYEVINADDYVIDDEGNTLYATYAQTVTNAAGLNSIKWHVYAVNLKTLEVDHMDLNLRYGLQSIDIVKGGFFIHGQQEYYLCKLENGTLKVVKYEYYPNPGAFGRGLLSFATHAAAIGGYTSGVMGAGQAMMVGSEDDYNKYVRRANTSVDAGNMALYFQKRSTMGRIDKDYAFFFSKEENKNLALFQIKKETGEEIATYKFDDKTPVYEIDYANGNLYYLNGKALKLFKLKGV